MNKRLILFYDGECAFCHWSVKLVARWLKTDSGVKFAPLQGVTAARLREEGVQVPVDLDAVCFVTGEVALLGPCAFYTVARFFRWPMSVLTYARFLPKRLSWCGYRLVARNRFRLFGRAETECVLPTAEQRAAQLD
jgi:predicted DCC family thiol-disulfide oxidoreductase YuxK